MSGSIEISPTGSVIYSGPDAVAVARAITLAAALRIYARTKIQPNRQMTPTAMLRLAGSITGHTFRRGEYLDAAGALTLWAESERAKLAIVDHREGSQ